MGRVAVLMAVYNGAEYLVEQVNSILAQTHSDLRLYIRDDGSTDDTVRIVRDIALSNEKVILLEDDHGATGSAAGNFFRLLYAVDVSGLDYVFFADQDDIWAPLKVEQALRVLREADSDCYSSNLISFDNASGSVAFIDKAQPQKKFDYLFQGASAGCTYCLSKRAVILVREVLKGFGCYRHLSHDWLVYAICRSHGLKWTFDPSAFVFYRQHSSNVFGAKLGFLGLLQRFSMSRSGWYRDHILTVGQILKGREEEVQVIRSIERLRLSDRIRLVASACAFRRRFRDVLFLGLFIAFFM